MWIDNVGFENRETIRNYYLDSCSASGYLHAVFVGFSAIWFPVRKYQRDLQRLAERNKPSLLGDYITSEL